MQLLFPQIVSKRKDEHVSRFIHNNMKRVNRTNAL